MKNKNKSTKKIALIIVGVVFLCLAAVGGWYYYNQQDKNNNPNQDNPITEADTNPSSSSSQDAGNTDRSSGSNTQSQSVPGSVTITTLVQDQDGVVVGTIVNGVQKGTCTAVFEKAGSTTIQETAPLGLQVSYYTCKGFNPVSINKFTQKGQYSVYVKVIDGSTEVRSNAQSITIN